MTSGEIDCTIDRASADDATTLAEIHVAGWKQVYSEVMPREAFREWTVEARAAMWREVITQPSPPIHTLVARDQNGDVLGFSCVGPGRDKTFPIPREIYAVYVAPEAQREGVGATLFVLTLQALREDGFDATYTWVPLANPVAQDFFEALGGVAIGEGKGTDGLDQVAFAWREFGEMLGE